MKSLNWLEKNGADHVGNQTDYFERVGYKPTWVIGDRVQGTWNQIPFRGTVGNDTQFNLVEAMNYNDKIYTVLPLYPLPIKLRL